MCKTSSPGCARALVSDPSRCGDAAWARPPPSWLARGTRVSQASSWTRPLRRLSRLLCRLQGVGRGERRPSGFPLRPGCGRAGGGRTRGGRAGQRRAGQERAPLPRQDSAACGRNPAARSDLPLREQRFFTALYVHRSPPRCGTERGSICTSAAPSMRRPLAKCPRSSPQRSATPSCGHTIPSAYRRPSAGRTRWSTSRATTTPVGPLPSSTPLPPSSPPSWRCLQKKSCRCRATQPATYCRSCRRSPWGGVRAYALPLRPQPSSAAGRHPLQKGGCRGPITAAATAVRLLAAHRTC